MNLPLVQYCRPQLFIIIIDIKYILLCVKYLFRRLKWLHISRPSWTLLLSISFLCSTIFFFFKYLLWNRIIFFELRKSQSVNTCSWFGFCFSFWKKRGRMSILLKFECMFPFLWRFLIFHRGISIFISKITRMIPFFNHIQHFYSCSWWFAKDERQKSWEEIPVHALSETARDEERWGAEECQGGKILHSNNINNNEMLLIIIRYIIYMYEYVYICFHSRRQ